MTYYSRTHIGLVRKKNEDSCFATEVSSGFFAIVADGMGGHSGGEVASAIVIETAKAMLEDKIPHCLNSDDIRHLLMESNLNVWNRACKDKTLKGMGSTATLVFIRGSQAIIGHVGDSRAYLFRNGEITQLTKDHSYVQMLIENGYITQEEALYHPHRNIITRAIGTDSEVEPDINIFEVVANDVLLLCSDGLNNAVTDAQITEILNRGIPEAADRLIEASLEAGGHDNISVVVAQLDGASV
jgi:serine/threonine protein phosphatase PrpC